MNKNTIIAIVIVGILVIAGVYYFSTKSSSADSTGIPGNQASSSSSSATGSNSPEDVLFNSYMDCTVDCIDSSTTAASGKCIEDDCYPSLVSGLADLGYERSALDSEFISKLNAKNQEIISCTTECDNLEADNLINNCIKDCNS